MAHELLLIKIRQKGTQAILKPIPSKAATLEREVDMEATIQNIGEKVKSGYLVAVLVVTGLFSAVTAVLVAYPALAFLASKIG
jgi:hypothetical protein